MYLVDTQIYFVERQLLAEKLPTKCPLGKPENPVGKLKWTGKIVDYVEWVYALHGVLNSNGETVTLKTLFEVFNSVFGLDVKEFSLYFTSIKNRKKGDRTAFLDTEKRLLMQRMEDADKKQASK